jgi:hypothetical protein
LSPVGGCFWVGESGSSGEGGRGDRRLHNGTEHSSSIVFSRGSRNNNSALRNNQVGKITLYSSVANPSFPADYFLKVHLHHFSKIKVKKKSRNRRNQGISYYFCLMIERSGFRSVHLTNGSGSRRPKNIRIRRIRIQIRIRNTAFFHLTPFQHK